ncbi:hypothetical protein RJ639_029930 [Escallonia herrerae]|uniref:Bromodomain associated domain-containing protein n=1 Tax=Escallonia herrerae TaxID=1293975 RepID=A0AA88X581_9ASTE|nr:hypothetical protein RJ639_029930 [Escallonia herrerae]
MLNPIKFVTMKSKTLESRSDASGYPFAVTRMAVAQICKSAGFKSSQRPSLETLADVAARYLQALARSAASSAALAGRTDSNLLDIILALEDLHGLLPGSSTSRAPYSSPAIADVVRFVRVADEIPFPKPLPRRDIRPEESIFALNPRSVSGFPNHVPRWLPEIPKMGDGVDKGHRREEKWEMRSTEGCCSVGAGVGDGERMERGLAGKRERVRFRMGIVGRLTNGVCRGGGKRVSCQTWTCCEDGDKEKICLKNRPKSCDVLFYSRKRRKGQLK